MSRASSLPLLVALAAAACGDSVFQNSGNGPPIGFAASYGIWTPGPRDDCTAEVHNSYSVVGPDRKLYPTWHPPVDPVTGCSFGHDHGRHPRGTDGTRLDLALLAAIGDPGQFDRSCDGTPVVVGPATPANSPSGGGRRIIPDRTCVAQFVLVPPGQRSDFGVLHESWQLSLSVRAADGHGLAFLNPYFQVFLPSRFYDPAATNLVGRPIDVCYEVTPSGARAQGEPCDQSTGAGTIAGVTFDDPRSVFNGVERVVDINENVIDNAQGPVFWFTDPFGKNGRTASFPGSIRQFIASIDNTRGGLDVSGPTLGRNRDYGGPRVHAPN